MRHPKSLYLYAESLVEVGKEEQILSDLHSEVQHILQIFKSESQIIKVFTSYFISQEEKFQLVNKIFQDNSPYLVNLFKILIKNNLFGYIKPILSKFDKLSCQILNHAYGKIETAYELDATIISRFEEKLTRKLNKKVVLKPIINKDLIAGIKITVDHHVYENSISSQLKSLKTKLLK
ncbi:F0F1 ATP synthase subunit delta [Mesomycoplasma conjunctivae]|uniref:ATP synthase subunit delta n=1 Tax=Mesomycoplasma conjunctivae (strain ATCC 25834 / NCTC 10147 / HRC/581) TaxID=572263 RepID=C5J780_MESCH|nr:F0F1 ATP synthase subunit delta [Mesomycoplasma conjunctivae]CAT05343.1 ATP synthase delta chain [Mesomycoplasma conjunctivae]VEU66569.1 F0F1 ATP synthase subunit delta [Mesomycoplasma conjunctivae]